MRPMRISLQYVRPGAWHEFETPCCRLSDILCWTRFPDNMKRSRTFVEYSAVLLMWTAGKINFQGAFRLFLKRVYCTDWHDSQLLYRLAWFATLTNQVQSVFLGKRFQQDLDRDEDYTFASPSFAVIPAETINFAVKQATRNEWSRSSPRPNVAPDSATTWLVSACTITYMLHQTVLTCLDHRHLLQDCINLVAEREPLTNHIFR